MWLDESVLTWLDKVTFCKKHGIQNCIFHEKFVPWVIHQPSCWCQLDWVDDWFSKFFKNRGNLWRVLSTIIHSYSRSLFNSLDSTQPSAPATIWLLKSMGPASPRPMGELHPQSTFFDNRLCWKVSWIHKAASVLNPCKPKKCRFLGLWLFWVFNLLY